MKFSPPQFYWQTKKHEPENRHLERGSVAVDCWGPPNLRHPTLNPSSALTRPTTVFSEARQAQHFRWWKTWTWRGVIRHFCGGFACGSNEICLYRRDVEAVTQMCWRCFWKAVYGPHCHDMFYVCIHAAETQYSVHFNKTFWIREGLGSSMESPRTNSNPGSRLEVERLFIECFLNRKRRHCFSIWFYRETNTYQTKREKENHTAIGSGILLM